MTYVTIATSFNPCEYSDRIYARVSTSDQDLRSQKDALKKRRLWDYTDGVKRCKKLLSQAYIGGLLKK